MSYKYSFFFRVGVSLPMTWFGNFNFSQPTRLIHFENIVIPSTISSDELVKLLDQVHPDNNNLSPEPIHSFLFEEPLDIMSDNISAQQQVRMPGNRSLEPVRLQLEYWHKERADIRDEAISCMRSYRSCAASLSQVCIIMFNFCARLYGFIIFYKCPIIGNCGCNCCVIGYYVCNCCVIGNCNSLKKYIQEDGHQELSIGNKIIQLELVKMLKNMKKLHL